MPPHARRTVHWTIADDENRPKLPLFFTENLASPQPEESSQSMQGISHVAVNVAGEISWYLILLVDGLA